MKKIITQCAFGAILALSGMQAMAQGTFTDLIVGHRGSGTTAQDSLEYIDTTAAGFNIYETKALIADIPDSLGGVAGLYGLALEPFTSEMYCVYGIGSGTSSTRRLGILDLSDASITDIGEVGTVNDITFMDARLFGSTGSAGDFSFGEVDKTTAVFTPMFEYSNDNSSNGFEFDYYKGRFLKTTQGASNYEVIDPISFEETSLPNPGHPGWTTTLLTINDSLCYSMGNDFANVLNTNTFEFVFVGNFEDNQYVHSSAFASYPTSLWVNGKRLACANEGTELVVVGDGTTFEWYLNDELIDGATESTYSTDVTGEYYAIVDDVKTNAVSIVMVDIETPGFVFSENPAYLNGAPSVDVTCSEIVSGETFSYDWDGGNGDNSTEENAVFTYDAIGMYDVTLTVTDDLSGCTGTNTKTLEVVGGLGLEELNIDFNLYPVPANDVISIQYNANESFNVQLMDLKGSIISNHIITPQGNNNIDINELAAGTYVLKIMNGNQVTERKFVKQ